MINFKEYTRLEAAINWIAIFAILFLMLSCGARKVQHSKSEIKTEAVVTEAEKKNSVTETKTEVAKDVTTDEIEILPIDTSKAVELTAPDGKVTKFKNATLHKRNSLDKTKVIQSNLTTTAEEKKKDSNVKTNTKTAVRNVQRDQFNVSEMLLSLWWLWMIIILILVWIYRKFFK